MRGDTQTQTHTRMPTAHTNEALVAARWPFARCRSPLQGGDRCDELLRVVGFSSCMLKALLHMSVAGLDSHACLFFLCMFVFVSPLSLHVPVPEADRVEAIRLAHEAKKKEEMDSDDEDDEKKAQ